MPNAQRYDRSITPNQAFGSAEDEYLAFGNQVPPLESLARIASRMRSAHAEAVPYRAVMAAGVHLDAGGHPEATPASRASELADAEAFLRIVTQPQLDSWDSVNWQAVLNAHLLSSYMENFRRQYLGKGLPEIRLEPKKYEKLLSLGTWISKTLQAGSEETVNERHLYELTGVQFEIGIHALIARHNLRKGKMDLHAWQALPRQDMSRVEGESRTGWDIAISKSRFLDPEAIKVQIKSDRNSKEYNPDIPVVSGLDDLHTESSGQILLLAQIEATSGSEDERAAATAKLDEFERLFLEKIGLGQTSDTQVSAL